MQDSPYRMILVRGLDKFIWLKIVFQKLKNRFPQQNMKSNTGKHYTKDSVDKTSSTSVHGGNQVDGSPPASSYV